MRYNLRIAAVPDCELFTVPVEQSLQLPWRWGETPQELAVGTAALQGSPNICMMKMW